MKTGKMFKSKVLALVLAVLLVLSMPCAALAASANDAVNSDASGVLQVVIRYYDDDGNPHFIQSGTGFLINNNTIITCDHVVSLDPEELPAMLEQFGKTEKQFKDRCKIEITVLRDVRVNAVIKNQSAVLDFAILTLEDQIYDRTCLPIRSSSEVQKTEAVWALGYPAGSFSDAHTYTSEDVTITDGQVSQLTTIDTVDYVQNSAKLLGGSSGGPLVDADGNVVGVCKGATSTTLFEKDYFYAVAIDQVTKALDSLGIEYTRAGVKNDPEPVSTPAEPADEPTPAPGPVVNKSELAAAISDAQKLEIADYTTETADAFSSALRNAQTISANADATQDQVDQAIRELSNAQLGLKLKTGGSSTMLIIIIVAAVVIIAVVVVIIIVAGGKKKKAPAPTPVTPAPFTPPTAPTPPAPPYPMGGSSPGTTVLNAGSNETTVLNAGSNETTVLGGNFGSLTRTKSGEQIKINNADFVIGKERARVSYCISDNTSVSRTHARIASRGGVAYAVDMKSTNGTFVNGVKLNPGQEVALRDGDKLTVADEEFIYRAQ